MKDPFLQAAIDEAKAGLAEGGIPIGSVLVIDGRIVGRGHNRRVQRGSAILHAEMDAIENAGRLKAADYRRAVLYSTLSPCDMCSGHGAAVQDPPDRHRREPDVPGAGGVPPVPWRRPGGARRPRVRPADGGVHPGPARALERGYRRVGRIIRNARHLSGVMIRAMQKELECPVRGRPQSLGPAGRFSSR